MRKFLLSCGAVSSVLYLIAIDVIVPLRQPGYHNFTSQMVSELMAVGAPTRDLLIWLFTPYNLLVFAFAAGVWASAQGRRSVLLTAAALAGYGVTSTAGLFLFPMALRGTVDSQRDALHIAATIVMSVFVVATMAFGAFARGTRFRRYSFATIAIVVVFGTLAGWLARPMPGPTPWLGLAERVNIYATMLWMISLAASLWQPQDFQNWRPSMSATKAFITKGPVLTYFAVTFALSWGGFLLVGGTGLLAGTSWQADPRFLAAVSAMLAGPPVAGILLTVLVSGYAGLRELISRLLKWRVGGRWSAVAILAAPIIASTVLLVLSRISPVFLPAIVTTDNKASLLVSGVAIGLAGGLVEELGWTGFAIPRLTARYGVLGTGLLVGPAWGVWHLLQMWWVGRTSSEALPLAIFLPVFFLSAVVTLTAYRVLMVWVYDRTGSLLVAVLMHASYIFSTLFVFAPPTTGVPFLTYSGAFAVALWAVVAAVAMANGRRFSRRPLRRAA